MYEIKFTGYFASSVALELQILNLLSERTEKRKTLTYGFMETT